MSKKTETNENGIARQRAERTGVPVKFDTRQAYEKVAAVGKAAGVSNADVLRFAFHVLGESCKGSDEKFVEMIAQLRQFANVAVSPKVENPFK